MCFAHVLNYSDKSINKFSSWMKKGVSWQPFGQVELLTPCTWDSIMASVVQWISHAQVQSLTLEPFSSGLVNGVSICNILKTLKIWITGEGEMGIMILDCPIWCLGVMSKVVLEAYSKINLQWVKEKVNVKKKNRNNCIEKLHIYSIILSHSHHSHSSSYHTMAPAVAILHSRVLLLPGYPAIGWFDH